jgi:hypothetical protein
MKRVLVTMGLALAASAGVAVAADLGHGQGRSARDLRFDRELERERSRRAMLPFKKVYDERRGPPYPVNWRGYPQSR